MTEQCCTTCVRCGAPSGSKLGSERYGFCDQVQEDVMKHLTGKLCTLYRHRYADMLKLHDPNNDSVGDCWRACIAIILGLPAEEVPHFVKLETDATGWAALMMAWFNERGYSLIRLDSAPFWAGDGFLCIASGMSPRGVRHCVVYDGVDIVHDPHPSRDGLVDFDLARDDCHLMLIVKGAR